MDLVEEEDRALPVLTEPGARPLRDLAHVLHSGRHGREVLEGFGGRARDEFGDGGLADSGWPPEDEGREPVGFDQDPQRLARPQEVLLSDHFVEGRRTQASRERRPPRQPVVNCGGEQIGALRHLRRLDTTPRCSPCARRRSGAAGA